MSDWHFVRRALLMLGLCLVWAAGIAQTQAPKGAFHPEVGQAGKDVVWVPTSQALVDKMLDLAKLTSQDYLIDLGSGDGRTVITAAKRGARALGIEYNPDMVDLSKRNAAKENVGDRAAFAKADLFESDFSQATVITMFLLPSINLKLRPKILGLKPGTRVVSNTFTMEDWKDDETATVPESAGCSYYCTAHLWIVPVRVEGVWQLPQGELTLKQQFQMLSGTLKTGGNTVAISGKLLGSHINFTAQGAEYSGVVNGNSMDGSVRNGSGNSGWKATRTGKPVAATSAAVAILGAI